MAKRKIVEVDEEAIKKMIAGDMPAPGRTADNTLMEEQEEREKDGLTGKRDIIENADNESTEVKTARRKKGKFNYSDVFLMRQKYPETRQTTVILDRKAYSSIRNILKTTDGITLANFINNVLIYHLNEYKDDIDELKKEYVSNLYNDK